MKMNMKIEKKLLNLITNEYIAGFVMGDGSFGAPLITNGKTNRIYIVPQFNLVQHENNKYILDEIKSRLQNVGTLRLDGNR